MNLLSTRLTYLFLLFFCFSLMSCGTKRKLQKGERLVTEYNISWHDKGNLKKAERGSLYWELRSIIPKKPNKKFLKLFRTRLWWHYRIEEQKVTQDSLSKFSRWAERKIAETPTLYDKEGIDYMAKSMEFYLNNKGYFYAKVDTFSKSRRKVSKVNFRVTFYNRLIIDQLNFDCPDQEIATFLDEISPQSLLKPGSPVDKSLFNKEKSRIVKAFREEGYISFFPNYITFIGDTTRTVPGDTTNHINQVTVNVIPPIDANLKPYFIDKIYVHTDYSPARQVDVNDTLAFENIHFIKQVETEFQIKLETISNSIFFKKGDKYKLSVHNETSKQLGALSAYKFVAIKFLPSQRVDSLGRSLTDCAIYLTLSPRMETRTELELNTVQDQTIGNSIGTFLNFNYINKNAFKGAELWALKASGGVEFAIGQPDRLVNTVDIRAQSDLYFPPRTKGYLKGAKSHFGMAYNYLSRVKQYKYNLASTSLGFEKRLSQYANFSYHPISLNFLGTEIATEFDSIVQANPLLASSFESQLLIGIGLGGTFGYTYSKSPWTIRINAEMMGNTMSFLDEINGAAPILLFDTLSYSQYARLEIDATYTKSTVRNNGVALHFNSGIGLPYGNSKNNSLPYVKQFFAGGTTSMRAWQIRDLGPGLYTEDAPNPYQTGDFKLELNLEYRYNLDFVYTGLEGAAFVDIGNIWSLNDTTAGGVKLLTKDFYKQLAVGAGFGFRLDFDFFIIRLDYAYQLRSPYYDIGNPNDPTDNTYKIDWVYQTWRDFEPFKGNWRLAIGYPF